jgi:hypothetical protein
MPISTSTPITHEGESYPYLAISLAISPVMTDEGVNAHLAMSATPYRIDGEGVYHYLPEQKKSLSIGHAMTKAATDADLAAFFQALMGAGQAYLTAKGL